jgi:hypothetical protein
MGQAAENAGVTTSVIRAMGFKKGRFKNPLRILEAPF